MKKIILLAILSLFMNRMITAQEMNFQVSVNTPKLNTVDPKVFEDLENQLEEFLNTRSWTDEVYEPQERINGNIQINIREELSPTEFSADLQIQASRPIYGSNSETVILSHNDKDIQFTYEQFQPIQFSINSFQDNLSSLLGFYVYYILGLDGDSFAPFGGEKHFQLALEIAQTIPNNVAGVYKGWKPNDGNRNRYWMTESMLNARIRPYRQGMYEYHRQGLDMMYSNPETAKLVMVKVLEDVAKAEKAYPNAMVFTLFANAKAGELVEVFKVADSGQKNRVKQIMSKIDAANASKYRAIGR